MDKKFLIYKSSAGSGKTYTLVKEYLLLALSDSSTKPFHYKKILALTFTNKAAAEMKHRILEALKNISTHSSKTKDLSSTISYSLKISPEELQQRSKLLLSEILHNYTDFAIGTIDSFTHKIVKTFAYDLKLPVNFNIETNTSEFYEKVVSSLLSKIGENDELTKLLIRYSSENAADNSSWDPQARLLEFTNLIQKEDAGINIEKLKDFSSDELNKVQVKVSTYLSEFTKKINEAGNAGIHLIKTNKLQTSNFNYGNTGPQKIFYKWAAFKKNKIEDILSKRTVDAIEKNKWHNDKADSRSIDTIFNITPQLNHLAAETLNYIEANKEKYSLFQLIQKNIYALILLNEIQKLSNDLREEEQIVFISDFNNKIAKIVADEPTPFIYERLGERYNHYLLDEFQDTSTLQWHNLLPLIDNSLASNNFNLIVGDGKQSIYRWRNANVKQFQQLPFIENPESNPNLSERESTLISQFEGKFLDTNYRSCEKIVAFNNTAFEYLPKLLLSEEFQKIYDHQSQKIKKENGGYVSINYGESTKEEVDTTNFTCILDKITLALKDGFNYNDICIIVRNNYHGNAIANHLIQNNIPVISSDSLLLKNNQEINCILNFLKHLNNNNDIISAAAVIAYCTSNLTNTELHLHKLHLTKNLYQVLNELGIKLTSEIFAKKNIFDSCIEIISALQLNKKNAQYIRFFLDEVNEYLVNKTGSINDFLIWWEKRETQASLIIPEGTNAVKVMTIHKSKGLEFPVVILPYLNWEVFKSDNAWVNLENENTELPVAVFKISNAIADAGLKAVFEKEKNEQYLDNINLLYVAFTRAVERLHIISFKSDSQKKENISSWVKKLIETEFPQHTSGFLEIGSLSRKLDSQEEKNKIPNFNLPTLHFNDNNNLVRIKGSHLLKLKEASETAIENGIKTHYVLSTIHSPEDLNSALDDLLVSGVITQNEKPELESKIHNILHHPIIHDYFKKGVQAKNEAEIITESGEILRPDRVILEDTTATVIDYKTGQPNTKKYAAQMLKYSDALSKMGYSSVKKIIVYIDENKVEELV
ncbi:MAG: UvrD-helicase domain-containing protein [Bacteroidetes bacterium]|nr:UvrD-helicase domain-containing protein [Bacteroidota bacterium]